MRSFLPHPIRNGIYGVDLQPIACRIAKLRFFISLAIEWGDVRGTIGAVRPFRSGPPAPRPVHAAGSMSS